MEYKCNEAKMYQATVRGLKGAFVVGRDPGLINCDDNLR